MNDINDLILMADDNDGKCVTCSQTIKIYRYKINKSHAVFLRAMAAKVEDSGKNDVDISTISLSYSVRTQVTKMRLHGLIARVKDTNGAQKPRRWLITHKGWSFLGSDPVQEKVVVYNNQVLGHEGDLISIQTVLGEPAVPQAEQVEQAPITEKESKVYSDVRVAKKTYQLRALFKNKNTSSKFKAGEYYDLTIGTLQMGKPVNILKPNKVSYADIAAFQRDWRPA